MNALSHTVSGGIRVCETVCCGSLAESWATLRASPMIASLVMLVVAYSVSHRLFEFAWKGQLRTLFPSALAYQARRLIRLCD